MLGLPHGEARDARGDDDAFERLQGVATMTGKRWRALHALRIGCAAILAFWACAAAAAEPVPFARDLAADGRAARESGRVIVVLYGTADCPYCRKVRKGFLEPMQANPETAKQVVLREIDVESRRQVVGFDGHPTTHARSRRAARRGSCPTWCSSVRKASRSPSRSSALTRRTSTEGCSSGASRRRGRSSRRSRRSPTVASAVQARGSPVEPLPLG